MRKVASIEARMTSSRLPGKVLERFHDGKSVLQLHVERLRRSKLLDDIVVATTLNSQDDAVFELCQALGVLCFRGSEHNVFERVLLASRVAEADILVQQTADCPFSDPIVVDDCIAEFLKRFPKHRYLANNEPQRSVPDGFDVRIFTSQDLEEMSKSELSEYDREHVSARFTDPQLREKYNPFFMPSRAPWARPDLSVTLDYPEDLKLLRACYLDLSKKEFSCEDVIAWIDENPSYHDACLERRR